MKKNGIRTNFDTVHFIIATQAYLVPTLVGSLGTPPATVGMDTAAHRHQNAGHCSQILAGYGQHAGQTGKRYGLRRGPVPAGGHLSPIRVEFQLIVASGVDNSPTGL